MTQAARTPSTCPGRAASCVSVMPTLRCPPVTGMRGGPRMLNPRRFRSAWVRQHLCNGVAVPGQASLLLTHPTCEHHRAGCCSATGCTWQIRATAPCCRREACCARTARVQMTYVVRTISRQTAGSSVMRRCAACCARVWTFPSR